MPDAPATPETGTPATPETPAATTPPAAPGTSTPATPDPTEPTEPVKLPDDHPLVKAYADTKARLKKREDAELSETERLTNDLGTEKERGDSAEARVALLEAALKHGLSMDDLALLGTGAPDELATRAEALANRLGGVKPGSNRATREGTNPPAGKPGDERTAVRELFGTG